MASCFELMSLGTVGVTFGACCSNVVLLEFLVQLEPSCTPLVTCAQFMFIAAERLISETRWLRKRPVVPISRYLVMVAVFFAASVLNNWALSFDIPMPFHVIFKSASLLTNMILGVLILGRRYSARKCGAVVLVSIGVIIYMLATAAYRNGANSHSQLSVGVATGGFSFTQTVGIFILILALLLSSFMGILQEQVAADYGKHSGEMMFYIHALALPAFVIFAPQMWSSFRVLAATERGLFGLPVGLTALFGNVFTQYLCISSVFRLTAEHTSLTVTLVITLRKFVSLLISVMLFGNPFSYYHWFGTILVLIGSLLFIESNVSLQHSLFRVGSSASNGYLNKAADATTWRIWRSHRFSTQRRGSTSSHAKTK